MSEAPRPAPTLGELASCFLQIALSSFGGGLSAWTRRLVVEQRRWMNDEQFLSALTIARLFPGPNQVNMAIYIGVHFRGLPGDAAELLQPPGGVVDEQPEAALGDAVFSRVELRHRGHSWGGMGGHAAPVALFGVTGAILSDPCPDTSQDPTEVGIRHAATCPVRFDAVKPERSG